MKVHPHNTVTAMVVTSTRDGDNVSLRATDGHASTLTEQMTKVFMPGDEVVLLKVSDYVTLCKGGKRK